MTPINYHRPLLLGWGLILITLVGCRGSDLGEVIETPGLSAEVLDSAKSDPAVYFSPGQELGEYQSWDLELGDLDKDGDLDLLIASLSGADPKVWLNDGRGSFLPVEQELPGCSRAELADLNGDGWLDLVLAEWDPNGPVWTNLLSIWIGSEGGLFTVLDHLPVAEQTQGMLLGYLNGDLAPDLFVFGMGGNQVWLNNGKGLFTWTGQVLPTGLDSAAVVGDLDGDGDQDLLSGGWEGPPTLWLNDGSGFFVSRGITITEQDLHIHGLAVGDLDADQDLDLFVVLANGDPHQVWLNDGRGDFMAVQSLPAPLGHSAVLGDLDGDGDLDAVSGHGFGSRGSLRVWINDGVGKFSDSGLVLGEYFTGAVVLGDLDQDQDLDLIAAQSEWDAETGPPDLIWHNQDRLED